MRTYVTQQNDVVDAIAKRAYGSEHNGATEAILEANRGLADYGPLLPPNLTINLPDRPAPAARIIPTVDLWS
jgi:phage tail protein X